MASQRVRDIVARAGTATGRARSRRRRGVVSVVSMMFLILFGSLAAAMAITSRGNITTAATHQHVARAMGAAETGLAFARQRLAEAASRFVVERGEIDAQFGDRLWRGAFEPGDGVVSIQQPTSYVNQLGDPVGLGESLAQIHMQDANTVEVNGVLEPTLGPAPPDTDPTVYMLDHWLRTPAVALTAQGGGTASDTAFQIEYAPLANGTDVRVIVTGYDFDYTTRGKPITRRLVQDYRLGKRVDAAVLSPSRIMIGKNVLVEGALGAVFDDVAMENGDPLIMKSDFAGIDSTLDGTLAMLYAALAAGDVDRDNRLRVGHPTEGAAIPDFDGSGQPDGAAADRSDDGYVDEFDLFLMRFDVDEDGRVVLSSALTDGTPADGLSPEFSGAGGAEIDDDLALLLDSACPDRNRNGVATFTDTNSDGKFDPGVDQLDDYQLVGGSEVPAELQAYVHQIGGQDAVWADQVLGYRDGFIDQRDRYAKVDGRLIFRTSEAAWIAGQGPNYMDRLRGSIRPGEDQSPIQFEATDAELPEMSQASFTNSENALRAAADGDGKTFAQQVADNLGIPVSQLATWTAASNSSDPEAPKYYPLSPDDNGDGLPDNWSTAYFEKTPYNSPNFADWYYRPVYENMVFRNVQIPEGTNGLFKECTFVGVTYVRSHAENTHALWTNYGRLQLDEATQRPKLDPPRFIYGDDPSETSFPTMLSPTDRPVLMATIPLDKADVPNSQVPNTIGYDDLPDPLIIDARRCVDTKALSNNIRFHDSLFVGSVVSDTPQNYTQVRNKLQYTGATRFVQQHPEHPSSTQLNPDPEDLPEIDKSSMMLPNYSVDIGSFNSPATQDVRLRGAIIAGVLDVRGNATIEGALLLTFKPVLGQPPLVDVLGNPVGNPSLFNASLGYFGPEDGDEEALDPETLPVVGGVRIVGYDTNGDGLADIGPEATPPAGAVAVPFHGYGGITLRFDPDMVLPDGVLLPVRVDPRPGTYREGSH